MQTAEAVAVHYDELDPFYREIWGDHVHHGYWATGRETAAEAADALVDLVANHLVLAPHLRVCDIGCGYGATAQRLAEQHQVDVVGVTISAAQAARGHARTPHAGSVTIRQQDWLTNDFSANAFDRAYAIESSEHMGEKQRFFAQAFRTLRPGGRLVVCAWLARTDPRAWEVRHLLEPICREGRLPGMGDEDDYRRMGQQAGFEIIGLDDVGDHVQRTWWVCLRRLAGKLATDPRYGRFLLDSTASNRIFVVTMLRLLIAYRTRSMRYCVMVFMKPAA
jgi:tocopherol O-methyltransferase